MLQAIIARFSPRSLKLAHQQWQQVEAKRGDNQQLLARELAATRLAGQATGVHAPENVGLLRQGQQLFDAPPPRSLLTIHIQISNMFAVHGTSRWRSAPAILNELIQQYETLIEAERQSWQSLIRRFWLIREVLEEMNQHPEYAEGLSPQYVLEYPEYAEALLALAKVQWQDRQVYLGRLRQSFKTRLNLGFAWLQLLNSEMSAYAYRLEKRGLNTLATRFPSPDNQDLKAWEELHAKLDNPLLRLNKKAINSLTDK